ncbi:MAG: hypothetical protein ACI8PZ_006308 [Myxococcota bacterium]|jgi:hypothetical protein
MFSTNTALKLAPATLLLLAGLAQAEPAPQTSGESLLEEIRQERAALAEERRALQEELDRGRRALAQERELGAEVASDADRVGYGEVVRIAAGETVEDVVGFGADVHVDGAVSGDATAFGADIIVGDGGRVNGDAISFGGRVVVNDGAVVMGDRVAMELPGVSALPDVQGATGSLTHLMDLRSLGAALYNRLIAMLSFAGAGVLVVGLFPERVSRIADALERRPVRAAVVGGFTASFIGLFSLLFAVVTLGLGLPVSIVLMAALGLAWLMGFVGLCQAVGDRLPFAHQPHGRWVAFLVGVMLLTFAGSLPLVGYLVLGAAGMVGVGAAAMTRFGGR